ncbi:MAG: AAA family ATPase [Verrucomicrobia bacterium]|nr:AAA family ATPase [Verrucomicrobiota bacterium]
MKRILIIAGPNGAGKTTFAEEFLPQEADCPEFVNADLIAAGLSPFQPVTAAFPAARLMIERIDTLVAAGASFALETTLASRIYLKKIPQWQDAGYRVELHFFQLPSPEIAVRRVAQRIALGGHPIPTDTIHRRFSRGWKNFQNEYKTIVDQWYLHDSAHMPPKLLESSDSDQLHESPGHYESAGHPKSAQSKLDGIEAALRRASEKAIARAKAAGLEPVLANDPKTSKQSTGASS